MGRIITVTSGKGGVGKTNLSVNLALQLSRMGHRTCLFDADLGLANINILMGLQPEYDLKDVIKDGKGLQEIMIRDWEGIDILPGSSGVEEIANLEADQIEGLIKAFAEMVVYDFLIFDSSAGISRNVISFCLASLEVVIVVTPEPTSLTDAYSLLKVLSLNGFKGRAKVVVNQSKDPSAAKLAYSKFKAAAAKYLGLDLMPLGVIYHDEKVEEAVKQQKPLLLLYPECSASVCIRKVAERLASETADDLERPDMWDFWRKCLGFFRGPLNLQAKKEERPQVSSETKTPEPQQETASTQAMEPSALPVERSLDGGFLVMMERLVESVSAISKELQLVRKAVEGNGTTFRQRQMSDQSASRGSSREIIGLDIEHFIKTRRDEKKEP